MPEPWDPRDPRSRSELEDAVAELRAAICRTRLHRWLLAACDQIVRLDAWWKKRRS